MIVTYLFRSPGTGHSIEELFGSIQREVDRRPGFLTTRIRLPHISRGWRSVWRNLRFLRTITANVYHITGDVHYAALALPASHTILTIHDCIPLQKNRNRPVRYALFWLLWYYLPVRRARIVTVVSEKTRQELIRYVGRVAQKAIVVPNGYDSAFAYRPAEFREQQPVLLQLGTAPNKNLSRLIAAIEGISCTLVIVGPLTDETKHELYHRRINYRNYVHLSRAQVIQLYEDCDIVSFLSTYEGFGMPVLEANVVGRVVITSAIAPMRDVADEAALLIDPTDITAIRQGVLWLIHDAQCRQKLIDAGRKNAQRYTVAAAAEHYTTLYRAIVVPQPAPEFVV